VKLAKFKARAIAKARVKLAKFKANFKRAKALEARIRAKHHDEE